jgi:hypothetical protein
MQPMRAASPCRHFPSLHGLPLLPALLGNVVAHSWIDPLDRLRLGCILHHLLAIFFFFLIIFFCFGRLLLFVLNLLSSSIDHFIG